MATSPGRVNADTERPWRFATWAGGADDDARLSSLDGETEPVEDDMVIVALHEVPHLDERARRGGCCAHAVASGCGRRARTMEMMTPAAVTSTSVSESREMTCREGDIPKTARAMRTVNQSFDTAWVGS